MSQLTRDIKSVLRAANSLKEAGSILKECERLRSDLNRNAFVLEAQIDRLGKTLGRLKDLDDLIATVEGWQKELLKEAGQAQERFKNTVAAELAKLLKPHDLEITGNFPQLKCAMLTLLFSFEKGGSVKIYYGPRVNLLKKVAVSAERIAEAVVSIINDLDDPPLDDSRFIKELYLSYRQALARGKCEKEEREQPSAVPIGIAMQELAFFKQKRSFRIDPKKENFTSYGRVKFSYDLARLQVRRFEEEELRLVVASMEQTKKGETSLWVPKLPQGDGTHYAFVVFAKDLS